MGRYGCPLKPISSAADEDVDGIAAADDAAGEYVLGDATDDYVADEVAETEYYHPNHSFSLPFAPYGTRSAEKKKTATPRSDPREIALENSDDAYVVSTPSGRKKVSSTLSKVGY